MKISFLLVFISFNCFANEDFALKKIQQFEKALKKELKKGLKKSPQEAIKVCSLKAPEIQQKISTDQLKIGRVSLKNRNPENTPKKWMLEYIESFHNHKIKKSYIVTKLDHKRSGLLKPIRTRPLCLKCHGTNIENKLKIVIKKQYPKDKAIGYKVGDIRGFFWVEY